MPNLRLVSESMLIGDVEDGLLNSTWFRDDSLQNGANCSLSALLNDFVVVPSPNGGNEAGMSSTTLLDLDRGQRLQVPKCDLWIFHVFIYS